jgi:hypothetical protein
LWVIALPTIKPPLFLSPPSREEGRDEGVYIYRKSKE